MQFDTYRNLDGLALAEKVQSGEVTPLQLCQLAIERAREVNPRINAIIHPMYEEGLEAAEALKMEGPFAGVPFLVKDLGLHVAGQPKREGSKGLEGYRSEEDSYLVERMRQAGLLIIGKTNTPEFGVTPYTEPAHFGPTRNPWDLSRTAGGSSGGSAAAVAAGIVPLATASDGGGSIRIPASNCGLFGLKPSRGRLTLGPQSGQHWLGATSEGCVSRSVRDSAAFLDAVAGPAPGDPYFLSNPETPYLQTIQEPPRALRIGYSTAHPLGHEVDPECIKAIHATVALCRELGHRVEEAPLPIRKTDMTEVFIVMVAGQAAAAVAGIAKHQGRKARRTDVEPHVWSLKLLGDTFTAGEFALAYQRWNEIGRRAGRFFQEYDMLLTPTVTQRPFPIGELQPRGAEKKLIGLINRLGLGRVAKANINRIAEQVYSYIPYTPFANMSGCPSMSVPLHWTAGEMLPVGSMFTAALGEEGLLLSLAAQLEQARPWFEKTPAL